MNIKTTIEILDTLIEYASNLQGEWGWKRGEVAGNAEEYDNLAEDIKKAILIKNELESNESLQDSKWKAIASAKFGDGRTVQEIEREAAEKEREACAILCESPLAGADDTYISDQFDCAKAIRARSSY